MPELSGFVDIRVEPMDVILCVTLERKEARNA